MAETAVPNRFFDAINETYDALLSAIEAGELRGHKVSQTVLEEARKGEKELVELMRRWVDTPTNVFDNLGAMIDAQARAQRRALELAQASLEGAGEYGGEVREAFRRVIKANRVAAEATVEVAREAAQRSVERVGHVRGEPEAPRHRAAARTTRIPVTAGTPGDSPS
jgi:predicted NBD/HSP70 family sugar kinase